jgi:hypothetical protein
MEKLQINRIVLRKFGVTMAAVFLVIAGLFLFRQKYVASGNTLVVSGVFIIMGLALPALLKPVYIIWMRFAFILGWINTRIILFILFYLIFTPLGLLMRLFRIDLLERKNKADSYWKKKEQIGCQPLDYERRF